MPVTRRKRRGEAGYDVITKKDPFVGNGRAAVIGDTEGVVKLIAEKLPDGSAGRLLGVHMAGPWVTEQLGQGYLAVNWEATVEEVAYVRTAAPVIVGGFRRDHARPGRKRSSRWLK